MCGYEEINGRCMMMENWVKNQKLEPGAPIDINGNCLVSDDPNPAMTCPDFWCVACRNENCTCDEEE